MLMECNGMHKAQARPISIAAAAHLRKKRVEIHAVRGLRSTKSRVERIIRCLPCPMQRGNTHAAPAKKIARVRDGNRPAPRLVRTHHNRRAENNDQNDLRDVPCADFWCACTKLDSDRPARGQRGRQRRLYDGRGIAQLRDGAQLHHSQWQNI